MGRRRRFIDKKRATTYKLVYREADSAGSDDEEGDRELVSEEEMQRRTAAAAAAAAENRQPLALFAISEDDQVQDEEQRQEIFDLGLPDDGYNYLRHLRSRPRLPQAAGLGAPQQLAAIPEDASACSSDTGALTAGHCCRHEMLSTFAHVGAATL